MHEVLNVQTCKLCGKEHNYRIAVETTPSDATLGLPMKGRTFKFAGKFHCPTLDQDFQGWCQLTAPQGEMIVGANVLHDEEPARV